MTSFANPFTITRSRLDKARLKKLMRDPEVKQAVKKSIKHWRNMIRTVEHMELERDGRDIFASAATMQAMTGTTWYGEYCAMCLYSRTMVNHCHNCFHCPLYAAGKGCHDDASPWSKVYRATTWKEWLKRARKMLQELEKL